MNEGVSPTWKAMQVGSLPADPGCCFLTIPAHPLPVFHPRHRCSSTFFPVFPRRASLTSELFHFLHKNKYPARGRVQHGPGCQNKPFLPAFPGQQQTQDDLPDLFCQNVLSPPFNKHSPNWPSSPYDWTLNHTFFYLEAFYLQVE